MQLRIRRRHQGRNILRRPRSRSRGRSRTPERRRSRSPERRSHHSRSHHSTSTRSSQSHRSSPSPSRGKHRGRNSRWSHGDDDDDDDDDDEEPEKQSSVSNNDDTTDEEGKKEGEEEEEGEKEADKGSSDEEEFDYEEDIEEEEDSAEKKRGDVTVISDDESDDEVSGFILFSAVVVDGYVDTVQSVLDITRCSGPTTSNRAISEACYVQGIAVFVARGNLLTMSILHHKYNRGVVIIFAFRHFGSSKRLGSSFYHLKRWITLKMFTY